MCGSSATTGWSDSSARPKMRRPGCINGSPRRSTTAPPPPLLPGRDFLVSLCIVSGVLECPPQEDPHPYRDLPGGFSKHLQGALFPPWMIGHNSMTVWEAHIVGAEWARELSRFCATTRALQTPVPQYAAVPLERWGGAHPAAAQNDSQGGP